MIVTGVDYDFLKRKMDDKNYNLYFLQKKEHMKRQREHEVRSTRPCASRCTDTRGLQASKMSIIIAMLVALLPTVSGNSLVSGYLEGIGYREQELQVAKGTTFNSEEPNGIPHAAFEGDTNIFIRGLGLDERAQANRIIFFSEDFQKELPAPPLTENDAFGSQPQNGFISYRIPSVPSLFGMPKEMFDSYQTMKFEVLLMVHDDLASEDVWLRCKEKSKCTITYKKSVSPVMHTLQPPVVYMGSKVSLHFDPKNTMSVIRGLLSDELPWINVKIGNALVDFEEQADFDIKISSWNRQSVHAIVGDQPISAKQNVTMLWETGQSSMMDHKMLHCSYDNQTCYHAKTIPVIYELSTNQSYLLGGLNLTVKGNGFQQGLINAKVGDVPCKVTHQEKEFFTCTIGAATNVSALDIPYVGQHGIRRTLVNSTLNKTHNAWLYNLDKRHDNWIVTEDLQLELEHHENFADRYGQIWRGWFIPPADTDYKFYMACDDVCYMNMANVSRNATATNNIIKVHSATAYRDYFKKSDGWNRSSEWQTLKKGEPYYIEVRHAEATHGDHLSVAVEIKQTAMEGHHHSFKERQLVNVMTENKLDTTNITVENADNGAYVLMLKHPKTLQNWNSESISAKATAQQMKNAIWRYYWNNYHSWTNVRLYTYDKDGNITSKASEITKRVYQIEVQKLIPTASVASIMVAKTSTKSKITALPPSKVQQSSTPLTGKFKFKCTSKTGAISFSDVINFNEHALWAGQKVFTGCSQVYDKIKFTEAGLYTNKENGISYYVDFEGLNYDVKELEIVPDETQPLTGTNLTFNITTERNYSSNLFYQPIPFEMLKTYETKQQLIVEVDGLPAACHNLSCDFGYIQNVGEITSFEFTEATKKLVIQGTDLPQNFSDIATIEFAQSFCTPDKSVNLTGTSITCTLNRNPTCGNWKPILISTTGMIGVASTVNNQSVQCSLTTGFPLTSLNLIGGDNITISGTNLPYELTNNEVEINFSDAQKTKCVPQESTTDKLVCMTEGFDEETSKSALFDLEVKINGLVITNSLKGTMKPATKSGYQLIPDSASPVLKTRIKIQLEENFQYTLNTDDFTVNATRTTNATYIKYLNIVAVNDTAKTIDVMFGGAHSGHYDVRIRHKEFGLIKTTRLLLKVESTVTSVTPKLGSIRGGNLLTITGTNFGTVKTDNPVSIVYNGALGATPCFVQTTEKTKITCRVDETIKKSHGDQGTVVVFLKTSEEAKCADSVCKNYTYTSAVPKVTNMTTSFEKSTGTWDVSIIGTTFSGTPTFYVGGAAQTVKPINDTNVLVSITNVTDSSFNNSNMYFDVGAPDGKEVVAGRITMTPRLMEIAPSSGSTGGSLITATVPGVGVKSKDLDLVDSNGASICKNVTVVAYGKVQCQTKAQEIAAGSAIKVKQGTETYNCSNTDASKCNYEQLSTALLPKVASVTKTDDKLVFTGSNFLTSDFKALTTLAGIDADSVTIDSNTQVTATFTKGLPPLINETIPELKFETTVKEKNNLAHFSVISSKVSNDLAITSTSTDLVCSFAGGCLFKVASKGLATAMKSNPTKNYIDMCGNNCTYSDTDSTTNEIQCKMPALSTSKSVSSFKIQEYKVLDSKKYFAKNKTGGVEKLFDKQNMNFYNDDNPDCYAGMEFREGYVAVLSKVRFFLGNTLHMQKYRNLTRFQGSNDGTTYTDLFTFDYNINPGWNYHEFNQTTGYPKYRYYRIIGGRKNGCNLNELELTGVETIDDSQDTHSCTPKLHLDGTVKDLTNAVKYSSQSTPMLTSISPRHGTVTGGDSVTFTGTDFSANKDDYKIIIDGIECAATAANATSVTCTTGKRPGLVKSSLEIMIKNKGSVATQGKIFVYANYWSKETTWGGEFAPMENESVYIPPGLNLLVDVDRTPILNAIVVEGQLIFAPNSDPNHERYFDARYIFVHGGSMEVGTEEHPYTSKITITMHGTVSDPYLPIYGNKVIGVREGKLDMHGVKRLRTWTEMEKTEEVGSTQITLREEVDWKAGEMIVIAPTDFEVDHAEKRKILSIDNTNKDKPVITLDKALEYKHFAETQYYGADKKDVIDMRAEVGLLTRNVVYRGDPETTKKNQYGATIFLHSSGDDSLTARLGYIECTDVGQAFKLGRYAIHFHMIGNVHNSYVIGNSVHDSNNRAVTLHGSNFLRIIENVVYNAKGHNIFIEDAVERNNRMERNLIMKTKRSWSLLNTDSTPGSFWITNPDNIFIGNHAAGSDRYGYWFDLQINAMGPSASNNICPENEKLGEFKDNTAHSNGRYGFRIFHNLMSRKYPCEPITYDHSNPDDPYHKNPIIINNFYNFTGWKNKRNGAILGKVGATRIHNFKVADNLLAGIEFEKTDMSFENGAMVKDALIVGRTNNHEKWIDEVERISPHGIIAPRSENFTVDGARFYNLDLHKSSALGSCSHCFHSAATDSGARQALFKNLYFDDATVPRRIRFQYPYKAIFKDLDGTLTEMGPNTWASSNFKFNHQPECKVDTDKYDGVLCDSTVQIRRLLFFGYTPTNILQLQPMHIMKWDDKYLEGVNKTVYMQNDTNWDKVLWREKTNPKNHWAFPIVTGHKYRVSWAATGLDFEQMMMRNSEEWLPTDKSIMFVYNHTDVRAEINVTVGGHQILNDSIPSKDINDVNLMHGQNVLYNQTEVREFHWVVNGKNSSAWKDVKFKANRCAWGICQLSKVEEKPMENRTRYWSNPKDWPNNTLPKEGEDVEVESGWNMVFDLNDSSPIFKRVSINGMLTFKNESNDANETIHLKAHHIFVRAGTLNIGSKNYTFQNKAKITLYGARDAEAMVYDNGVEAGNKIIANVGKIFMYGKSRTMKVTRLYAEARKGQTYIMVDKGLDVVKGEKIGIAPTGYETSASDYMIVDSYDNTTGKMTFTDKLKTYHWGAPVSTGSKYNGVDIRAEVVILERNIKIVGDQTGTGGGWGGQILTGDLVEADLNVRQGQLHLNNVEIFNCSQINTENAALRWQDSSGHSSVNNTSIHNGLAWGINILGSSNVYAANNTMFRQQQFGVQIQTSRNVTLIGNTLVAIIPREIEIDPIIMMIDKGAGMAICSYLKDDMCSDIYIQNNIVAGADYGGFIAPAHDCGDHKQTNFINNVAHSARAKNLAGVGGTFFPKPGTNQAETCYEMSGFVAYKNWFQGAFMFGKGIEARFSNMTMIDNRKGIAVYMGQKTRQYEKLLTRLDNIIVYGDSEIPDCIDENNGDWCFQEDKYGVFAGNCLVKKKDNHIQKKSALPPTKLMGDACWGLENEYTNLTFVDFKKETLYGLKNSIIGYMDSASDFAPPCLFKNSRFINVAKESLGYMKDPNPKWANVKDCGNFPCTAPWNTVMKFLNTSWEGGTIAEDPDTGSYAADFQLIPNNPGFSPGQEKCKENKDLNGYYCEDNRLGLLIFESRDEDWMDRSMQPINVTQVGKPDYKNVVNSQMDHVWDGFYAGQKRQSRFPIIINVNQEAWDIAYTGTPAKKQYFELKHEDPTRGVTLRIAYPGAGSYSVTDKNDKVIEMNQWDDKLQNYGPIKQEKCGENRYIGVKNILEFYITGGCVLKIVPRDAIQTLVRMEWTLDEFYSKGGTTSFMDRIAGSLGIHASTIKVVSVYQGSLVVNYEISVPEGDTTSPSLAEIQKKQTEKFATGGMDLGAPILDVATTSVSAKASATESPPPPQSVVSDGVVSAQGYTPIVITKTETNKFTTIPSANGGSTAVDVGIVVQPNGNTGSTFVPNVPIVESESTSYYNTTYQNTIKRYINGTVVEVPREQEPQVVSIVYEESNTTTGTLILVVACVIIVAALITLVVRFAYRKSAGQKKLDQQKVMQRIREKEIRESSAKSLNHPDMVSAQKELEMSEDYMIPVKGAKSKDHKNQVRTNLNNSIEFGPVVGLSEQVQYDPTQDFKIFGVGDPTKGGNQTLKDKMNLADEQEKSDEELEDIASVNSTPNVSEQIHAANNNRGSSAGHSSALPEDKEIEEL